jgi:ribosomal protein S18 acetylase RimI-like enzyme
MSNPSYSWTRTIKNSSFTISNDTTAISRDFVQTAFATDEMDWAVPVSSSTLELIIRNGCTLGIYSGGNSSTTISETHDHTPAQTQIGFARIITDFATIAYLTDVYIDPNYRDLGLGKWLMACVREINGDMPALRRSVLLTDASGKGPKFYEKELGMKVFHPGDEGRVIMMQVPAKND